jgi:hypothetical protein
MPLAGFALRQANKRGLQASLVVDAGFPVFRPTFTVEGGRDLFRAEAVVGRVALSLAWVFF